MADTLIREGVAYGSQPLSPVPQYWDGTSYAKVQGTNGAMRAILFDSAGETFTDANPGSVTVVSSAGGSAILSNTNPAYVGLVSSAGSSILFTKSNPGNALTAAIVSSSTLYSATITWSAGTTATSSQTLTINAITATVTTTTNEIVATNDSIYAITMNIHKVISANASTFTTSSIQTIIIPAQVVSAGLTINATRAGFVGYFNHNTGIILNFTITASFTATVTNNIIIKEMY